MKISPITFTQKYVRSINAVNQRTKEADRLNFVMYEDDNQDKNKLKFETSNRFEGVEGAYAKCIYQDFADNMVYKEPNVKFWGIEDEEGNIQALMETASDVESEYNDIMPNKKGMEVSLMCVNSENSYTADDRKYRGLGLQLVSNAIQQAKEEGSDFVMLQNAEDRFWDGVPCFEDYYYGAIKVLEKKDFTNCIKRLDKMA